MEKGMATSGDSGAPKDGSIDEWRVSLHVRHGDEDIARRERRVGEEREQLIVQRFQFAHRAMAAMDLDGMIVWRDGRNPRSSAPSSR